MADNVILPPGGGGATIRTEDDGTGKQLSIVKIHNGAANVDGGPITTTNPLDVALSDGTARLGTAGNPIRTNPIASATAQAITYPARTYPKALGVNSLQLKNSTGSLCSFKVRNRESFNIYAMLFDATSVPANGTTPADQFLINALSERIVGTDFFSNTGAPFATGVLLVLSSTESTLTITTTAANHDISGVVG